MSPDACGQLRCFIQSSFASTKVKVLMFVTFIKENVSSGEGGLPPLTSFRRTDPAGWALQRHEDSILWL